jgi:hypothetical protein
VDRIKSIAVPVTRRDAIAKRQRAGRPLQDDVPVDTKLVEVRQQHRPTSARPAHRYRVGERLALGRGSTSFARPVAACKVVALVPHETGPLLYRIRSDIENFERIVDEADLAPLR